MCGLSTSLPPHSAPSALCVDPYANARPLHRRHDLLKEGTTSPAKACPLQPTRDRSQLQTRRPLCLHTPQYPPPLATQTTTPPSHLTASTSTFSCVTPPMPRSPATQHPHSPSRSPFPPDGRNDALNTPASHNETHVLPRCSTLHSARRGSAHQLDPLIPAPLPTFQEDGWLGTPVCKAASVCKLCPDIPERASASSSFLLPDCADIWTQRNIAGLPDPARLASSPPPRSCHQPAPPDGAGSVTGGSASERRKVPFPFEHQENADAATFRNSGTPPAKAAWPRAPTGVTIHAFVQRLPPPSCTKYCRPVH
ncbi:hypothetical protein O3P69_000447 [Scylla paramamosain]|uniref:Uncharacterized protein n=1 Tax=Scylla paramamosain TaxID=85552 RepID=A0AAW0UXD6_SCYPA